MSKHEAVVSSMREVDGFDMNAAYEAAKAEGKKVWLTHQTDKQFRLRGVLDRLGQTMSVGDGVATLSCNDTEMDVVILHYRKKGKPSRKGWGVMVEQSEQQALPEGAKNEMNEKLEEIAKVLG